MAKGGIDKSGCLVNHEIMGDSPGDNGGRGRLFEKEVVRMPSAGVISAIIAKTTRAKTVMDRFSPGEALSLE